MIASAKPGSSRGSRTASTRIARTSASMDLPCLAARMRSRSSTRSSRFRMLIAAMPTTSTAAINASIQRLGWPHGPFPVASVPCLIDRRAAGAVVQAASDLPNYPAGCPGPASTEGRRTSSPIRSARQPLSRRQTGRSWQGLVGDGDRLPAAWFCGLPPHHPRQAAQGDHRRAHPLLAGSRRRYHHRHPLAGPRHRDACLLPAAAAAGHPQLRQGERADDGRAQGVRRGQPRR